MTQQSKAVNTAHTGATLPLRWVKLSQYTAMSGDTPDAVDKRLRSGAWVRDVHARQPEGSRELGVNLEAVNDWAAGAGPAYQNGKSVQSASRR